MEYESFNSSKYYDNFERTRHYGERSTYQESNKFLDKTGVSNNATTLKKNLMSKSKKDIIFARIARAESKRNHNALITNELNSMYALFQRQRTRRNLGQNVDLNQMFQINRKINEVEQKLVNFARPQSSQRYAVIRRNMSGRGNMTRTGF